LFYFDRGRIADARSAYLSALNLTPNNELLYRNLAVLDMSEGKFREASDRIAKTTQFEPVARTYLTLGMAYYYQRRYAESAAAFNSGIQLDANLYGLWGDLGEAYLHIPDSEQKAKDAFRKAITLAEKHLEAVRSDDSAHADLAEYWATLKRKDRAEDEINKIPPQSRNTFADRLVPTYELLGNRRQAVQIVQSLRPDDPLLIFVKNDPDLELLWRDPALRQQR
jgi:tetratricopeptide (TPR) repeat protein